MSVQSVIVVGGGIGGLAAALALGRQGFDVIVLERAAEFAEIGAGIQLAPNATRALRTLGVLDPVVELGVMPDRLVLASAMTGEELTHLDLRGFEQMYGGPYIVAHRSDLMSVLYEACLALPGVDLRPATDVAEFDSHRPGGGVTVTCSDGTAFTADVLIGADGLHSVVRRQIDDSEAVFSGYVAYRGALALDEVAARSELGDVVAFIGPGLHFVQYPLREKTLYNQVAVFRSDRWAAGRADWGGPDEMDERFSETCEHVRTALQAIQRSANWPMYDREPLATWQAGSTVLLGDAAHPMLQYLAQGACQAIQDGVCLAGALAAARRSGQTADIAFAAYEARRLPPTAEVQRKARAWGDLWHADGLLRQVRDEYLRDRDAGDQKFVAPIYDRRPE